MFYLSSPDFPSPSGFRLPLLISFIWPLTARYVQEMTIHCFCLPPRPEDPALKHHLTLAVEKQVCVLCLFQYFFLFFFLFCVCVVFFFFFFWFSTVTFIFLSFPPLYVMIIQLPSASFFLSKSPPWVPPSLRGLFFASLRKFPWFYSC